MHFLMRFACLLFHRDRKVSALRPFNIEAHLVPCYGILISVLSAAFSLPCKYELRLEGI
jgi:hypothetical protein